METKQINKHEAPIGFHAVLKPNRTENICRLCDARKLCQQNENDWCLKNRCMSYEIIANGGKTYKRKDECSVIFKINDKN